MNSDLDTIAAIATPAGEGGIAVVRIAGPRAGEIGRAIFRTMKGAPFAEFTSHRIYHGRVADPKSGAELDEALLLYFAQGKSYTGDETVEITCHGGPLVTRRILDAALAAGAAPSGPGQFTRRAYLAGRIDISQAEAVADLIAASSDREMANALSQMDGSLSSLVKSQAAVLEEALANIESRIDFPDEEDIGALQVEDLKNALGGAIRELGELAATYREGRVLREGYRVVIVGRTNVGKSSLLNRLLGADRAIVTSEPGTTRDIIEERVMLGGVPFILTDTAGIRYAGEGSPEQMGVRKASEEVDARRADPGGGLLLVLLDSSEQLCADDEEVLERAKGAPHIVVLNKTDLERKIDASELPEPFRGEKHIAVSALKGHGMKELIGALVRRRTSVGELSRSEGYLLTSARHKAAVDRAVEALERAAAALENQPPEIVALEVRLARDALDDIAGQALPDDVLDIIFSRFCIGK